MLHVELFGFAMQGDFGLIGRKRTGSVADPGGVSLGKLPPRTSMMPRCYGAPLIWRPSDTGAPLFAVY